jgi:hypothetical protein
MEELIKGLRVGNVFCLMQIGDMPKDKCMYSTKLFAERVIPKLRDMFVEYAPDYLDDGRFWCHPIENRAAPGSLPAEAELGALVGAEA